MYKILFMAWTSPVLQTHNEYNAIVDLVRSWLSGPHRSWRNGSYPHHPFLFCSDICMLNITCLYLLLACDLIDDNSGFTESNLVILQEINIDLHNRNFWKMHTTLDLQWWDINLSNYVVWMEWHHYFLVNADHHSSVPPFGNLFYQRVTKKYLSTSLVFLWGKFPCPIQDWERGTGLGGQLRLFQMQNLIPMYHQ